MSASASLAALPVAHLAGELGPRAIMGATGGAIQVGSTVLADAGPQLAAQVIAATVERDDRCRLNSNTGQKMSKGRVSFRSGKRKPLMTSCYYDLTFFICILFDI